MFRDYIKWILLAGLLACLIWVIYSFRYATKSIRGTESSIKAAHSQRDANAPFQEGKHYQKLSAKVTTNPNVQQFIKEDAGKIQVVEFFSYACFWCYRVHPHVNAWVEKREGKVAFYRFPVVFSKGWDTLAKAYYMVQVLNQTKTLDDKFFTAIHKESSDLANEAKLKEFFGKQGISEQKFSELYGSFDVNQLYSRGNDIISAFQITTSPSLVLNVPSGSYFITAAMAGSEQGMIEVLNYLISRETKVGS